MKKTIICVLIILVNSTLWSQQKFALVIGNGNYNGISQLRNPVNDANDVETVLRNLGFTVEKILNGGLEQMETGVINLKRRLGSSRNTYGFFFYAGHGVQANGENYLIPIEANNIHNETHLRQRAVSLQFILDSMNEAGNELNMIVLDACRDNPFSWSRSGARGLSVISQAPTGSIVMYATSANSVASDGTGRNGLFTTQLLSNLGTQGLSVFQVFDNTMSDVINISGGRQHPELSLRFPGSASTYLGTRPTAIVQPLPEQPSSQINTSAAKNNNSDIIFGNLQIENDIFSIGERAYFAHQLTSVNISDNVISIGKWAFANNLISSVTIANSVISIEEGAFANNQLNDVSIPNSVTFIGEYALSSNRFTNVTIPNNITSISAGLFANNQLTNVVIPNNINSIGRRAFVDNRLSSITIPNSVTSIGAEAFLNNNLSSITIGSNVSLGIDAFGNGFEQIYSRNRQRAGTYRFNGSRWSN